MGIKETLTFPRAPGRALLAGEDSRTAPLQLSAGWLQVWEASVCGCGAQCVLDLVHSIEFFLLVTSLLFALPRAKLGGPGVPLAWHEGAQCRAGHVLKVSHPICSLELVPSPVPVALHVCPASL